MFDLRDPEFQQKLNSATKFPSIPTFHEMDAKTGILNPSKRVDFAGQPVNVTEKIDGTNARIIVIPGAMTFNQMPAWVIGSRENLLTSDRDWIHNPELGIVAELVRTADRLAFDPFWRGSGFNRVRVYYFEVYGGRIGQQWMQYSKSGEMFGHRLFDVVEFDDELFMGTMSHGREEIAAWRERGNQPFVDWERFLEIAFEMNLECAPIIERIATPTGVAFDSLEHTLAILEGWFPNRSQAWLEEGALRQPEGVVFKSHDRKITAKLRFQDYRGTLHRQKIKAKREAGKALREFE